MAHETWQMGHSHPDHPTGTRYNASNIFPAGALLDSPAVCKVYGIPENWSIEKCEAFIAASTETDTPVHVGVAHARLIAAAPELLAALQKLVAAIDRMPANAADGLVDEYARAAIAKAAPPILPV
jgi:hypothetical protein